MADSYIDKLHSTFGIPPDAAAQLIRNTVGKEAKTIERIVKGYDNEVYSVETDDGKGLILRLRRDGEVSFAQEAWAMNECRRLVIPVPALYFVGEEPYEGGTLEVMIEERAAGRSAAALWNSLNGDERARVLQQSGQALSRMHEIKVGGFFRRRDDGSWDFNNWEALAQANIQGRTADGQSLLDCGFTRADFSFLLDMLGVWRDRYPCRSPVLCHGDYKLEHLFFDENLGLSAVIDFGEFQGGAPAGDLAYFSFQHPEADFNAFLGGYFGGGPAFGELEMQVNLHKLSYQIGYLAHCVRSADTQSAAYTKRELEKTLRALRE